MILVAIGAIAIFGLLVLYAGIRCRDDGIRYQMPDYYGHGAGLLSGGFGILLVAAILAYTNLV